MEKREPGGKDKMSHQAFAMVMCFVPFVGGAIVADMILLALARSVTARMDREEEIDGSAWEKRSPHMAMGRRTRSMILYATAGGEYGTAYWNGRDFIRVQGRHEASDVKWYCIADLRGTDMEGMMYMPELEPKRLKGE